MTPLSPCATFSSLELNTKRGLVNKSALPFPLPPFLLVFAALLQPDSDYKELNYYSNWKNGLTFSLAEDWEGGSVGGRTLCVWGEWRAGGEKREGVWGWGWGGNGGVRIAGCGWVCQCHVSSLAPLASRLEGCWTESLAEPVRLPSEPKVG